MMEVIQKKFGTVSSSKIREADNILIATESRDLMSNTDGWAKLPVPLTETIQPLSSIYAEILFLFKFSEYNVVEE